MEPERPTVRSGFSLHLVNLSSGHSSDGLVFFYGDSRKTYWRLNQRR